MLGYLGSKDSLCQAVIETVYRDIGKADAAVEARLAFDIQPIPSIGAPVRDAEPSA